MNSEKTAIDSGEALELARRIEEIAAGASKGVVAAALGMVAGSILVDAGEDPDDILGIIATVAKEFSTHLSKPGRTQ